MAPACHRTRPVSPERACRPAPARGSLLVPMQPPDTRIGPAVGRDQVGRGLLPALILGLGAWAVGAARLDLAGHLGVSAPAADGLLLFATVLAVYPAIALLERLVPADPDWNRPHGDVATDAVHLLLSGTLAQAVFQATLGVAALHAGTALAARWGLALWPASAPLAAQLFLAVLVAELGHYAFHRLSHEHALVWRLHAVHHSARRLYWLNATRFHWLDVFALIALQSTPLLLLGAGREALLAYTLFAATYGQVQHMNVRVRPSMLDRLFSTPTLHRWHHSIDPREGNTNYGAILIVWDLVFGTYRRPARPFDATLGVADHPDFPEGWLAQQLSPLRRRVCGSGATDT